MTFLTQREWELAGCVREGMSNKEIANHLKLSQGTVKIYLSRLYGKLQIGNRNCRVMLALMKSTGELAPKLGKVQYRPTEAQRAAARDRAIEAKPAIRMPYVPAGVQPSIGSTLG